ncbi:MAG TPA: ATP-binding protein [Verrucomicrobiae bacterium]
MSSDHAESKKTGGAAVSSSVAPGDLSDNLRRLDRLANLGLVSASIAHEIKNGLVAISTFVELLLQKGDDREMTEVVRRELKRIDSLTTQMLRFSAPKPAARTRVRAHDLLDHSLRLLEHQMSGRMIGLKRDYRAAPDTVQGDEFQLQQAFMNLLLNAVEAVGSNGEVTVATENAGGRLKISIRDTGLGISTENLARLFEPFFTTKKQGTGLGLAICRRVMDEHHGQVEVHSETGKGSVFILSLPLE